MKTLLIAVALISAVLAQPAGPTDGLHGSVPTCVFDAAGHAVNQPCTALYSDATVTPPTLFYELGAPLTYTLTAPAGTCDVQLTTWEPNKTAAGQRLFSVQANGHSSGPVDLFASAGLKTPYVISIPSVPVQNGQLTVQLLPQVGNAVTSTVPAAVNCQPPPPAGLTSSLQCPAGVNLTIQNGLIQQASCNSPCTGVQLCAFVYHETLAGIADGQNVTFMLTTVPYPGSVQILINAQVVAPDQYTIVGATVTFKTAPAAAATVQADYRA